MNLLQKIVSAKNKEVQENKSLYPIKLLEKSIFFNSPCVSLKKYLNRDNSSGIIAEFKRKSPSKGDINKYASLEKTTLGYMQSGATALSILTDEKFFGGSKDDLIIARKNNYCPILRKDFIIDEYQIIESKSIGADAILLIGGILTTQQIEKFSELANSLGMEVILEIREKSELNLINNNITIVGVNNRNLKTFEVNISQSYELAEYISHQFLKISESGIESVQTFDKLRKMGYKGFLIGEYFMKNSRPEEACSNFIKELNLLINEN